MSPCNGTCKLQNGKCIGCGRDKATITAWGAMDERDKVMWMLSNKWSCKQCGGEHYDHEHRCVRCGGVMIYRGEK